MKKSVDAVTKASIYAKAKDDDHAVIQKGQGRRKENATSNQLRITRNPLTGL